MFNLLPKETKEAIRLEYRLRLLVVGLWFLALTFVIASVLLIPSLLLSGAKERAAETQHRVLTQSIEAGEAAQRDDALVATRDTLKLFRAIPPNVYLYQILSRTASVKPARVSLEEITVTTPVRGKQRLDISGRAADRGSLVAFSEALNALGLFESVELPLNNLAKETDITFSLTVIALQ